jgi:hypothetical protein
VRGVVSVFLAAGGKQNRRSENGHNQWHHKERGRDVHSLGLPLTRLPNVQSHEHCARGSESALVNGSTPSDRHSDNPP